MPRHFKELILKLACLSKADRKWILSQIPESLLEAFKHRDGFKLLDSAKRFKKLNGLTLPAEPQLAPQSQNLAKSHPGYIALILQAGAFDWEAAFLDRCTKEKQIQEFRQTKLHQIKPRVKDLLFKDWQEASISPAVEHAKASSHEVNPTEFLQEDYGKNS